MRSDTNIDTKEVCPACRGLPSPPAMLCSICDGKRHVIYRYISGDLIEIHAIKDDGTTSDTISFTVDASRQSRSTQRISLNDAWVLFKTTVHINHASMTQQREMKRAFYSGVDWMLNALTAGLDPSHETTASDLEYMENVQRELELFAKKIAEGRA